jgi:hypothetical protein
MKNRRQTDDGLKEEGLQISDCGFENGTSVCVGKMPGCSETLQS